MNSRPPWEIADADADGRTTSPAADVRAARRLIVALLLAAAALDLTRCGLAVMAVRHPAPVFELAAAGLAAAALSVRTARGCRAGRRWAIWAAFLIGVMSAPQASASGFHGPYMVPDTATAALGILLTVAILATAGRAGQPGHCTENPCIIGRRRVPGAGTTARGPDAGHRQAGLPGNAARSPPGVTFTSHTAEYPARSRGGRTEVTADQAGDSRLINRAAF